MLGIAYKSAWFMAHRIREGMKETSPTPMGGSGQIVEADETYFGNVKRSRKQNVFIYGKGWVQRGGGQNRYKVLTLVERDDRARSVHVKALTANTAQRILRRNLIASPRTSLPTSPTSTKASAGNTPAMKA